MTTTQTQYDETQAWRAALAAAKLTNDDIRDVTPTRGDDGRVEYWSIMLQNGRRYRLTVAGELVTY